MLFIILYFIMLSRSNRVMNVRFIILFNNLYLQIMTFVDSVLFNLNFFVSMIRSYAFTSTLIFTSSHLRWCKLKLLIIIYSFLWFFFSAFLNVSSELSSLLFFLRLYILYTLIFLCEINVTLIVLKLNI